jgi:hypothetical protein
MSRHAIAAALLLSIAACPAPADVTPMIHVDPRAAQRIAFFGRRADQAGPGPARVHAMKAGEQLGGPNAVGRPGDLVLENDEVVFVVDQLGEGAGFAESGGNLVDAADARARSDELGQQFTYFGTFPRQGVYDALSSGAAADGSAWVEARGRELYDAKLLVTTRYTLRAPDRALLLETTLENTGDAPVALESVGDAVQWGGAEKVAPGKARGFKGESSGAYVGGVGRFVSYATTSTDGSVDAVSGSSWTDTAIRKDVKLAPGEKTTYARVFVVGERPDTSSLVAELAQAAGEKVGAVAIDVRPESPEAAFALPADARVSVRGAGGAEVMTIHASDGKLAALLPPGKWTLAYAGGGGRAGRGSADVDVPADGEARARLVVSSAAAARARCKEGGAAAPCKVTFERTDGGPPPDFGPAHAAGAARHQATSADGVVDVPLAPGVYRVTASRGPEYALAQADVTLAPGERKEIALAPVRVVDTDGYLGCDFHQHTMLGADAAVATRDRVIANAAEGLDVAVASEHNVVADLSPLVRELHLERALVALAGDELTTDASRTPWGHANVFPMPLRADQPRGGAPPVRDRAARDVFDELRRALPADFVLQINHPRTGLTGYFDQLAFDPAKGVGTGAGYDARFDALEVWNGRNVDGRDKVLADFYALLRTSHPVTATADTDTHGIVGQEAGYPRTYVRVGDDTRLDAWDAARTADLVRGVKALRDVVLTSGPFLRVSAAGAGIGGVARGRVVTVKVHVEAAPWVAVDTVRLIRASAPDKPIVQAVALRPVPSGALAADVVLTLRAAADDAFVVVASGSKPLSPVLGGDEKEILPWAMTGAVWVDADGDGRSLGRSAAPPP